jgi:sugar phosphate isomerase/epimerase
MEDQWPDDLGRWRADHAIEGTMRALCLDHLSLVNLTALELIEVAAALGCSRVSLFVSPLPITPALDLAEDKAACADVVKALADHGLGVGVVEPFMLDAAPDWEMLRRRAEVAFVLGGAITALGFDDEPARLAEAMGRMAGIARAQGITMLIEAFPFSAVKTQSQALRLAEMAGPDVGLCVDTLHVMRSGGSWADVAALPPERIRHVQLSDGPLQPPDDRILEAVSQRLPPGRGEFGLAALLPIIPAHAVIAVEAPFVASPELSALQRGRILVEAAQLLMAGR